MHRPNSLSTPFNTSGVHGNHLLLTHQTSRGEIKHASGLPIPKMAAAIGALGVPSRGLSQLVPVLEGLGNRPTNRGRLRDGRKRAGCSWNLGERNCRLGAKSGLSGVYRTLVRVGDTAFFFCFWDMLCKLDGQWPEEKSSVVTHVRWRYEHGDDQLSIEPIPWGPQWAVTGDHSRHASPEIRSASVRGEGEVTVT